MTRKYFNTTINFSVFKHVARLGFQRDFNNLKASDQFLPENFFNIKNWEIKMKSFLRCFKWPFHVTASRSINKNGDFSCVIGNWKPSREKKIKLRNVGGNLYFPLFYWINTRPPQNGKHSWKCLWIVIASK